MNYYKEQLKKAEDNNIRAWELVCATAVYNDIANLTDEQFECICDFVYDWVMNTDAGPEEVVRIISNGLGNGDITRDQFTKYEDHTVITDYINSNF